MRTLSTLLSLIFVAHSTMVGANQSIESISALTTEHDVMSAVENSDNATENTMSEAESADGLDTSGNRDSQSADDRSDAKASKNNLPPVGYVPEQARRDGQFNLVAETANETDQLFQKSVLSESKKHYESALKTVQRMLLIEPEHPGALLARGRLLVKTHQYSAAIASLESITISRTDDWRPWFWLGTAHLMNNDLNLAEQAFDEALARDSDVAESWLHRALVAQQRGDWQVALQLLSIANEISPDHPLVMLNVAMCREALGYQDEAANGYRKFLAHSHRTEVSKLLRFEVINHLTTDSVAVRSTELQQEAEAANDREFRHNDEIIVDNFNEIPIISSPDR